MKNGPFIESGKRLRNFYIIYWGGRLPAFCDALKVDPKEIYLYFRGVVEPMFLARELISIGANVEYIATGRFIGTTNGMRPETLQAIGIRDMMDLYDMFYGDPRPGIMSIYETTMN